ncbi:hypothetical protein N7508_002860 [Penicillium antarcticum]|uniref:uncharacterized protein n=1 Tax=Penicillium antarcticum TaxID=416450 RepID=UPI00238DC243|nr:uncharacterized protein N7508_002860 [Penicillium antarcticum]KAJ5312030.1 hypothetical protein N7508_002860 [Penicillium antarcticum]
MVSKGISKRSTGLPSDVSGFEWDAGLRQRYGAMEELEFGVEMEETSGRSTGENGERKQLSQSD